MSLAVLRTIHFQNSAYILDAFENPVSNQHAGEMYGILKSCFSLKEECLLTYGSKFFVAGY